MRCVVVQDKSKAERSVKGSGGENSRESRHAGFKKSECRGTRDSFVAKNLFEDVSTDGFSASCFVAETKARSKKTLKGALLRCLAVLKVSSEFSETLFSLKIVRE